MEALVIVAHGSRWEDSRETMEQICQDIARRWPYPVHLGYLQFQYPSLKEVIVSLWQEGFRAITVVPAFLSWGTHVAEDIPTILRTMRQRYPGLRLFLAAPLGYDPRLAEILLDRVRGERKEIQ